MAASAAAAATGVRFTLLANGTTEPSGSQSPEGYVAYTRLQERRWSARLTAADRAKLGKVDLTQRAVVATFLDGAPCVSDPAVTSVTRAAATITVHLRYTRPPIGVATCVRTSTSYSVLTIARKALAVPAPTHVTVDARARA